MLNIASKIAAGEWRGVFFYEEERVNYDFTEDEFNGESWTTENDYGIIPSPQARGRKAQPQTIEGESWEVD